MGAKNNSNVAGTKGKTLFPFRYIVAILLSISSANMFTFKVNVSVAIIAMANHTRLYVKQHLVPRTNRKTLIPFRYIMCVLLCISSAIMYSFEVNTSVAIVAMVNHTAIKILTSDDSTINSSVVEKTRETCYVLNNTKTVIEDGPFVWDEYIQGLIMSAYLWGYMASLLFGARIVELWSAKWVINISIVMKSAICLFTPVVAQTHYSLVLLIRFLQGMTAGPYCAAVHVVIAKWAPPNERNIMVSIIYSGPTLGTAICLLVSGVLATNLGWQFIFYVGSAIGLICGIVWRWLIADSPEESRLTCEKERNYIMTSLGHKQRNIHDKKLPVPWRQILRSKPFIAIIIVHCCNNFGWYIMLFKLPTFMKQILKFDMSSNARLSSLPFLCMWIFTMVSSKVLAVMQEKELISMTMSRKIATFVASLIPSLCFIGVSYVGCNRVFAVVLMTIAVTSFGATYSGYMTNIIDIAPNFAGTLLATTNFTAAIPGIVVPIFVGKLTRGNQTIEAWRIIFFIAVGLHIIEMLVYAIFGSCNEEPWNTIELSNETCDQILSLKNIKETDKVTSNHELN